MIKIILVLSLLSIASSYDPPQVHCPWSDDGKTRLVYNGVECVEPQQRPISTQEPFSCPTPVGYYRSPNSESQYYNCQNGVPLLETCPLNTVFDGKIACVKKTSIKKKPFKCPKSKGKFRVTRSLRSQYYQCNRNRPRLRSCPPYYYFNGRECVEVKIRRQRQEFQCPADNGVYADQRDDCCFWVCRNRSPTRGNCPINQCGCVNNWNQVSGVIIHQDNCNRIVDTWNPTTHQWDRSYRTTCNGNVVQRIEHHNYQPPRFVYTDEQQTNQQGIPGYPVDDAKVLAESMLDNNDYYYYK